MDEYSEKRLIAGKDKLIDSEDAVAGLSLKANFLWTLIGNVIYGACQWGMIVIIAKLTNAKELGHFALGLAIAAPIIMFFSMQLRAVQATDVKEKHLFKEYLGHRLIALAIALIIIIIIAGFYGWHAALIIVAVGVSKVVESVGDIIYGYFQHRECMDRIAQSMMIKGLTSLLFLAVAIWATRSVFLGAASLFVSWLIVLATYDLRNLRKFFAKKWPSLKPSFRRDRIFEISLVALPLGIASLLMSVNSNVPRYFIDAYMGSHYLGIYAALAYPVVAGSVVIMALGQALTPRLAGLYLSDNMREFKSMILKMAVASVVLALGGVVAAICIGKLFLRIAYTLEYSSHLNEFILIMGAGGMSYFAFLLGYALTAAQRFRIQAVAFGVNLVVTIMAGFSFIPTQGLRGAAYSVAIGSFCQILIEAVKLTSLVKSPKPIYGHEIVSRNSQ